MNNPFSRPRVRLAALRASLCSILVLASVSTGVGDARADTFSNFKAAKLVIGQASVYDSSATNTQKTTPYATDVALSSKNVLAVSQSNGRVVLFNSFPTSNGANASIVVGKPDFTSTTGGTTASLLVDSYAVAFSPEGNKLLAADYYNNRVLIWNSIPTQNGQPADVVIGQTSFTTGTRGKLSSQFSGPTAILVTPSGQLLVSDYGNNRVLLWNALPTQSGQPADVVIGQPSFDVTTAGFAANQLSAPYHMALTADGKLLVCSAGANSVRIWNSIPAQNGVAADVVIGQNNFSTGASGLSATKLAFPRGVSVSPTGQLAIGDSGNNRVLIYNSIPTTNGAAADAVLGQPDFGSNATSSTNAKSLNSVGSVSFLPSGPLMVANSGSHRVAVFGNQPPVITTKTLPSGRDNESYSFQLVGRDMDDDPLHWSVSSGALPPGITLSDGGLLSGTPPTAGTFPFSVLATDGYGESITANFTLKVLEQSSLVVTTTADNTNASDGLTSLREAIATANANDGSKAYTITFADNVRGTIDLKSIGDSGQGTSAFALLAPVEIRGPGAGALTLRRESGGNYRIFRVGDFVTAAISGLTISNGTDNKTYGYTSGGGIYNTGYLTLTDCVVTGNSVGGPGGSVAGGIYTDRPSSSNIYNRSAVSLLMRNCTVSGNYASYAGGGIGIGTLTTVVIQNSTIANNTTTYYGGGIENNGFLTMQNSTVSGNRVNQSMPYDSRGIGAAISSRQGNLVLSNSTFSGNSAPSAIYAAGAIWVSSVYEDTTITDCTIAGNSAPGSNSVSGIYVDSGRVIMKNSIVVGPQGSTQADVTGALLSNGYNLVGNRGTTTGVSNGTDRTGSASNPLDAKLGPLGDHGGPTLTHSLLPGSLAINGGSTEVDTDQRGFARPVGSADDIGAVEYQNTAPLIRGVVVSPAAPTTNTTLQVTANILNIDGDTLATTYTWKKNDAVIDGETASTLDLSKEGNGDRGDVIVCVVTVSSGKGGTTSSTSNAVTVGNSAPTIANVTIDQTAPRTDAWLSFTAQTLSDGDGDTLTQSYQWKKNGANIEGQTSASMNLSVAGNGDKGDKISVVVTASDGTASTSVESDAVTIVNSAPSITGVAIQGADRADFPKTNDHIFGLFTISDADGDQFTKSFKWRKNGELLSINDNVLRLEFPGVGDHGDTISFIVFASDGTQEASAESDPVTVQNTPPTAFSVDLGGTNPGTSTVLRAFLTLSTDADSDTITTSYIWKKNGEVLADETGETLDLGKAGNGDTVSVTATRDDGHGGIVTAGDSRSISDSPGKVTSVTLTPVSPTTNTVLQATAEGGDPDGDAVGLRYYWYKNGEGLAVSSTTLDLSQAGFGDRGDIITVKVSAGDAWNSMISATVVVGNSAPTLVPATFKGSENTALSGRVVATDADSDPLTFSVVQTSTRGTLKLASDGTFSYVPNLNWNGTDSFQVKATDNSGASASAIYNILVPATNGVPVANADVVKGYEDVPLTIAAATLLRNDSNGEGVGETDALRIVGVTILAGFPGTLRLDVTKQTIVFTPRINWNGEASFLYTVQDSKRGTARAQVKLQIAAVNDAPIVPDKVMTVVSGTVGELVLIGTDVENDVLSFGLVTRPVNGNATVVKVGANWVLRYQSRFGFSGTDKLTVVARDGKANSAPATVTITVKPNSTPQLVSLTPNRGNFRAGSTVVFEQQVSDADGTANLDAVALVLSSTPATLITRGGGVLWFDAVGNTFTLTQDDGKTTPAPVALGRTLENSQMRVTLGTSDVIRGSNGLLVLRWRITFKTGYVGTKSLWGRVEDLGGLSAGFANSGQITLGSSANSPSAPTS